MSILQKLGIGRPREVANPKDSALLERIDKRFKDGKARIENQWKERSIDMRYVDGDTLDPTERQYRKENGRPWFDLDEINQYENQVINDILANRRGVKFSPVGFGANDETARFYADKWREVEYRSKAPTIAYPMALKNCVWGGFGYVRLCLRYKQPRPQQMDDQNYSAESMMQDLWIEQVADPNTILPDQDFQMPDMSDIRDLFVLEQYSHDEFTAKFPNAQIKSFDNYQIRNSNGWVNQKTVQVAEYYWIEEEKAFTMALIEDKDGVPRVVKAEVLEQEGIPDGFEFKRSRDVMQPKVKHVITNGVEILERNDWPGIYIPFAGCLGKMFWRDKGSGSERVLHSMTRLARNPATLYSYYNTVEGELLRLVPKFPYFYYENTLSPEMLQLLQKSYDQPVAGIAVKPVVEGLVQNTPLGFPQRAPYDPPFVALQAGKESARQGIRAAMGLMPLSTNAGKLNEKSGVALKEMNATSQQGAFHFPHALNMMIEFVGVQGEDLMDKVLTGIREESIFDEFMKPRTVRINDPSQQPGDDALPSIRGHHQVTVSVGPSDDSEREVVDEFLDTLVGSKEAMVLAGPDGAKKIMATAIRAKNMGPHGEAIADVFDPPDGQQGMDPMQAQQMLAEAKQIMEAQAKEIQELQSGVAAKQIETESRERISAETNAIKLQIAEMQTAQKARDSELDAKVDLMLKRMEMVLEARKMEAQERQDARAQQHDRQMAQEGHAVSLASQTQAEASAERQAAQKPQKGSDA